ncbi:hypothetical protein BAC3_01360 [uncultured bacterium]|nr:hypothetical protein BAC3_01360 [uncultured bacterium]
MEKTTIKILILAANPWNTHRLSLDEEYQRIQELWINSDLQKQFELRYYPALRGEELQQKVLKFKPHIIHFSGHGEDEGLVFNDTSGDNPYQISKQTLAQLFSLCSPELKAVFLNACHSAKQADDIVNQVDYVVGMNAAIDDLAAINFAEGFYTALFTQQQLDIEQAFNAGLNQMAIAKVSETEQQKPVLQKRRQLFVPNHTHDIAISFAESDAQWAKAFIDYLHKQLKLKLETAEGFQIYSGTDFEPLETSAMLLIIASPNYLQQYDAQLERLSALVKQKPSFLLETDTYKLPEGLKGLSRHKFWHDDDEQGIMTLQGEAYIAKANQVAELVAKKLQELQTQYQYQQRLQHQRQTQSLAKPTKNIDAFIFLHSAPEDLDLTADIVPLLDENGIDYVLPLKRTIETTPTDIRQDIENNILNCDAVLILYEHTTHVWIREQLGNCRRLQRKRENPLKIIAVYKHPDKPEPDLKLDNLHIYCCEASRISEFLSEFMEALA